MQRARTDQPRSAARPGTPARPRPTTPAIRSSPTTSSTSLEEIRLRRRAHRLGRRSTWRCEDEAGDVAAVMPLYLKSHSQGEYIFDHAWADAYERAGRRAIIPSWSCASPFSPVTGPRLLVRAGRGPRRRPRMPAGRRADRSASGSAPRRCGVNFPTEDEWRFMGEQGLLQRQNQQYHWLNARLRRPSTTSWRALSSGRRKTIRRERRDAQAGLEILRLTGADLDRGALGRLLRLLHGHRLAQVGPALSQPPLLLAAGRADGRPRAADHGRARTAAGSPAPST